MARPEAARNKTALGQRLHNLTLLQRLLLAEVVVWALVFAGAAIAVDRV